MTYSMQDLYECAVREVKQRKRIYRRRVTQLMMSEKFAEDQIAMMERIAELLRPMAEEEADQKDLFGSLGLEPDRRQL